MLVLVSDIHLTDFGGRTAGRGQRLVKRLSDLAMQNERDELDPFEIAFLGDIFDLLHSQEWLTRDLRPWETPDAAHQEIVRDIYNGIKENNAPFFDGLRDLKSNYSKTEIHYIVGNHDRVLNTPMGERIRSQVFDDMRIGRTSETFQDTLLFPRYGTIARHGHEWDPRNVYALGRAAIGDFIVIDVLEQFPRLIAEQLDWSIDSPELTDFRELAYVLPQDLRYIMAWISDGISKLEADEPRIHAVAENALLTIIDCTRAFMGQNVRLFLLPQYAEWMIYLINTRLLKNKAQTLLDVVRRIRFGLGGDPFRYRDFLAAQLNFASFFLDQLNVLVSGHTHEGIIETKRGNRLQKFINTGAWNWVHKFRPNARLPGGAWSWVHKLRANGHVSREDLFEHYEYAAIGIISSQRERDVLPLEHCKLEENKVLL